jgi:hypothetical protein
MSRPEKAILGASYTIADFQVIVSFPTKYQDEQLAFRPPGFQRNEDGRKYILPISSYANIRLSVNPEEIAIIFPNLRKDRADIAKIILSVISGAATILLGFPALKKDHRHKFYYALAPSLIILGGSVYFLFFGPEGTDFPVFASALWPPAAGVIVASGYLFVARCYQATIVGQIFVDDHPTKNAKVTLHKIEGSQDRPVSTLDTIDPNGEYEFTPWIRKRKTTVRFFIKEEYYINSGMPHENRTNAIDVSSGQTVNIGVLKLSTSAPPSP